MKLLCSLVLALFGTTAFAVTPQFWSVGSADELLGGEIEGMTVTAEGHLIPGPAIDKLASFNDPFVFAQAAGPGGAMYFGTGNEGHVYRLKDGKTTLLFTAPEPEVYALAYANGALYVGSSPNGKVYRIDPESGKSTELFDPKQGYIWAIEPLQDGSLVVATGIQGRLYRVDRSGNATVLFEAPETHLRSIAVRKDGTILVGGSGEGRIYEVNPGKRARALYDSGFNEIPAIWYDSRTGTTWAAGVSNVLPTAVPKPQANQAVHATATSKNDTSANQQEPSGSVDVSLSFEPSSSSTNTPEPSGSAELYRIDSDGFVQTVRKFDHQLIYGIGAAPDGGIYLSTGPQGRIYEWKNGTLALAGTVPDKQVVSARNEGKGLVVTTTNGGAVYRLSDSTGGKWEYRSPVKDTARYSRFGHYHLEGSGLSSGGYEVAFRSGNTSSPDDTWSEWIPAGKAPDGTVSAPAARFLQWKISGTGDHPGMVVDDMTAAYVNRNVAPVIDAVQVQDPGVIFISSNFPAPPQVIEATNPDEHGIFTSVDSPQPKNDQPGKKYFRKGFRTISWSGHDENGDDVRYSLEFRRKGSDKWLRLHDDIDGTQFNFDGSQLPDGIYELQLTASDARSNAENPLKSSREGLTMLIDNTPPVVAVQPSRDSVTVEISDALSPITKVDWSVDAHKWMRLVPEDGIADSNHETFRIKREDVQGHFVIVRAMDGQYNVTTTTIDLSK